MRKTKIPLGDNFDKETHRKHLRRFFPFLYQTFRPLEKKELTKAETLKELFGETEKDFNKLRAVYEYQNI